MSENVLVDVPRLDSSYKQSFTATNEPIRETEEQTEIFTGV